MIQLYSNALSGNAYKIRLFMSLIELDYRIIEVDLHAGESHTEEFLKINPRGQIPVLVDDGTTIWDSHAILIYLARRYASDDWLPMAPAVHTELTQWMAVAQNEVLYGLARARAAKLFGLPWDLAQSQALGISALEVLDQRLNGRRWLVTDQPTIADIACFPYVAMAPAGEVDLAPYAAVAAWIGEVRALPNFIPLPGE